MDAQEAEAGYRAVKAQLDAKQITQDEFNKKVAELMYQDNAGTWWAVSPADGSWLKRDGEAWVPAFAQAAAATSPQSGPRPSAAAPAAHQPAPATGAKPKWPKGKKFAAGSIICGILGFAFFPFLFVIGAVILGALAIREKSYGGAVGIVLGLAAFGIDQFWPMLIS